jgi:hypothetical protein
MKNRAKCKLCNNVIESFHTYDYVTCNCGEISISGGNDKLECSAKNWENFLRVDDQGNEISVRFEDGQESSETPDSAENPQKMSKKEMIGMFEAMVKNIENLPKGAMSQAINHYDMFSFMAIILAILKHKKNT